MIKTVTRLFFKNQIKIESVLSYFLLAMVYRCSTVTLELARTRFLIRGEDIRLFAGSLTLEYRLPIFRAPWNPEMGLLKKMKEGTSSFTLLSNLVSIIASRNPNGELWTVFDIRIVLCLTGSIYRAHNAAVFVRKLYP